MVWHDDRELKKVKGYNISFFKKKFRQNPWFWGSACSYDLENLSVNVHITTKSFFTSLPDFCTVFEGIWMQHEIGK